MEGWIDGWMDGGMEGWIDGLINVQVNESIRIYKMKLSLGLVKGVKGRFLFFMFFYYQILTASHKM